MLNGWVLNVANWTLGGLIIQILLGAMWIFAFMAYLGRMGRLMISAGGADNHSCARDRGDMMGSKLFTVRPGLWKRIRKEIYERDKGICRNCGRPVKENPTDPDWISGTDKPTWTVHHEISQKSLQIMARSLCEHLSGQEYIAEVRNVYTRLATDKINLELRCGRLKCRQH